MSKSLEGEVIGCFPVHVVTTIFYILRKSLGKQQAMETTRWLIASFEIAACDKSILSDAAKSAMTDFEDAVLAHVSLRAGCDYIGTRNETDFGSSPVTAISPTELLSRLATLK